MNPSSFSLSLGFGRRKCGDGATLVQESDGYSAGDRCGPVAGSGRRVLRPPRRKWWIVEFFFVNILLLGVSNDWNLVMLAQCAILLRDAFDRRD